MKGQMPIWTRIIPGRSKSVLQNAMAVEKRPCSEKQGQGKCPLQADLFKREGADHEPQRPKIGEVKVDIFLKEGRNLKMKRGVLFKIVDKGNRDSPKNFIKKV